MDSLHPLNEIGKASWFPFSDEPVIEGLWYIPRLSSPVFLFPEESPDGKWHLFAHSYLGINHYTSDSGIMWEPNRLVQLRGKHPFLFKEKGLFYLIYERHGRRIPFFERRAQKGRLPYLIGSHIEIRSSTDLSLWSEPKTIFEAKEVDSSGDYLKKRSIGHPQLIAVDGGYRLYVGSSKVGKNPSSSRYLISAFCETIEGPYIVESQKPLIESEGNDIYRNLATGRVSVYKAQNLFVALQNGRYWNEERQAESSAITLLKSEDGKKWSKWGKKPILIPAQSGWASKHIVGCDIRYKADEACWYCYFSATGEPQYGFVRESIGLLIGRSEKVRQL
ncbi:MAG: hypothetical protein WCY53_00570 [Sphaerochaetaceae bacterium]